MLPASLALFRVAFQRQLAYRFANLSGLVTNLFFGWLRASILVALFAARERVAGYTVADAVTYTGLTQAILAGLAMFGWWDLIRSIRSGEVAADLSRPVDFYTYWCAQDLGRAAAHLLVRGVPILAAYALFYPLRLPPTLWHWLALGPALLLATLVSFAWRFGVSLAAFWTQDVTGVGRVAWSVAMLLSGFIMPLDFFPDGLRTALGLSPFAAMIDTVTKVYLGLVPASGLPAVLALQAFWFLALTLLCRLGLRAGVRKLVIQGG